MGWQSSPHALPPPSGTPRPSPALAWASKTSPPVAGDACAVRGEGRAWRCAPPPPPFVPRVGEDSRGKGSRQGRAQVRSANATTIPHPWVPGVRGAWAPRAHPPARGIRPRDRQRRRPCPAPGNVCKVSRGAERSAHPRARRGRGAGVVSELGSGASRDAGTCPVQPAWRASSRSPSAQVRPAVCAEARTALARWPLAALPPPSPIEQAGNVTKFPSCRAGVAPGVPGEWRSAYSTGEVRREGTGKPGKLKRGESTLSDSPGTGWYGPPQLVPSLSARTQGFQGCGG